jgi:hypothetical protein
MRSYIRRRGDVAVSRIQTGLNERYPIATAAISKRLDDPPR